jgi:hypothetical protein
MTVASKNWVKNNLFNISTLIAVVTFMSVQAKWQGNVDSHISNKSLHMEFEKKIQIFVPRFELDARLANIEKLLDKIDTKIPN